MRRARRNTIAAIVGAIADLVLEKDPATRDRLREHLGTTKLSEAARWMDCAKGYCDRPLTTEEEEFVDDNPKHHNFHYTDVPYQQTEYRPRSAGTERFAVVQVITHAYRVLKGPPPTAGPRR